MLAGHCSGPEVSKKLSKWQFCLSLRLLLPKWNFLGWSSGSRPHIHKETSWTWDQQSHHLKRHNFFIRSPILAHFFCWKDNDVFYTMKSKFKEIPSISFYKKILVFTMSHSTNVCYSIRLAIFHARWSPFETWGIQKTSETAIFLSLQFVVAKMNFLGMLWW
jgi:hypothetical protein